MEVETNGDGEWLGLKVAAAQRGLSDKAVRKQAKADVTRQATAAKIPAVTRGRWWRRTVSWRVPTGRIDFGGECGRLQRKAAYGVDGPKSREPRRCAPQMALAMRCLALTAARCG